MKILVLNFEYPPIGGGASPVSEHITMGLHARGHELSVVTMAYGKLPKYENRDGIDIYRIESGRALPNMSKITEHLRYLWNGRRFLKNHLKHHSYDVIHCHFIISSGFLAYWVKRSYGIPYIITPHGSDLPGYNPDHFKLMHYFTPMFIGRIINDADHIATSSAYLASLVSPFVKNETEKISVIPNGIGQKNQTDIHKKPIILSTGRLLERKGFHHLINALRTEDCGYQLHIAGDGPMMNSLKSLALGSKTKIVFHGWMDNTSDEYIDLLSSASIYSLVSRVENASLSILEAMQHGCAVITSDGTGCKEMVGECGVLVKPGQEEMLRNAIYELIENPKKVNELGSKAMERVKSIYNWENIVLTYESLLDESVA